MDWLVWITQLVTLVALLWVFDRLRRMSSELRKLEVLLRVREGRVASKRSSISTPEVDSRARTTRRDTPDIPARGGRMSQAVQRRKRDVGESDTTDD